MHISRTPVRDKCLKRAVPKLRNSTLEALNPTPHARRASNMLLQVVWASPSVNAGLGRAGAASVNARGQVRVVLLLCVVLPFNDMMMIRVVMVEIFFVSSFVCFLSLSLMLVPTAIAPHDDSCCSFPSSSPSSSSSSTSSSSTSSNPKP